MQLTNNEDDLRALGQQLAESKRSGEVDVDWRLVVQLDCEQVSADSLLLAATRSRLQRAMDFVNLWFREQPNRQQITSPFRLWLARGAFPDSLHPRLKHAARSLSAADKKSAHVRAAILSTLHRSYCRLHFAELRQLRGATPLR